MSLEQEILVDITQFKDHLATVAGKRHVQADIDCVAYRRLLDRGDYLLFLLIDFQSAVPDRAFAPLIRGIVGPQFDVPDAVYSSDERTRKYCINWLQTHVKTG